jgi:outer membrane protein
MMKHIILVQIIILSIIPEFLIAQKQPFSVEECIVYAWENSTDIGRANNSVKIQDAYLIRS